MIKQTYKICGNCKCWVFREEVQEFEYSVKRMYGDCHYEPKIISKEDIDFCMKGFEWDESKQRTAESNK